MLTAAILISLLLITVTVLVHYEALRATSRLIPKLSIPVRSRILVVIGAVLVAHMLEICLYALTYFIMQEHLGLGRIEGPSEGSLLDLIYFSISSFTTLGVGDLYPSGPIRLVAGLESLNGLVLIGWSASFTYLSMEKFWSLHPGPGEAVRPKRLPGRRRPSAEPE